MKKNACVVTDRPSKVWKAIKVILILAAVCFVAVKVYRKFFKKKKQEEVLDEPAAVPAEEIAPADDAPAGVSPAVLEVPADAVIAEADGAE